MLAFEWLAVPVPSACARVPVLTIGASLVVEGALLPMMDGQERKKEKIGTGKGGRHDDRKDDDDLEIKR